MRLLGLSMAGAVGAAGLCCTALAEAPATVALTLKDHMFIPNEIHLPAGKPTILEITNTDPAPEEFEMRQLAIEKVVTGGGTIRVRLHPLGAGRYPFIGDYNEATAHGVIVVDPAGK